MRGPLARGAGSPIILAQLPGLALARQAGKTRKGRRDADLVLVACRGAVGAGFSARLALGMLLVLLALRLAVPAGFPAHGGQLLEALAVLRGKLRRGRHHRQHRLHRLRSLAQTLVAGSERLETVVDTGVARRHAGVARIDQRRMLRSGSGMMVVLMAGGPRGRLLGGLLVGVLLRQRRLRGNRGGSEGSHTAQ